MEADHDNHDYSQQVSEIEEVEVCFAHFRQCSNGDGTHDQGSERPGEYQRGTPDANRWGVARPDLGVKVGWVENGNDHSKLGWEAVEGWYPGDVQEPMYNHQDE